MKYLLYIISLFLYSCQSKSYNTQLSLKEAKSNKSDIEKVLKHYESNKQKLDAAKFLPLQ